MEPTAQIGPWVPIGQYIGPQGPPFGVDLGLNRRHMGPLELLLGWNCLQQSPHMPLGPFWARIVPNMFHMGPGRWGQWIQGPRALGPVQDPGTNRPAQGPGPRDKGPGMGPRCPEFARQGPELARQGPEFASQDLEFVSRKRVSAGRKDLGCSHAEEQDDGSLPHKFPQMILRIMLVSFVWAGAWRLLARLCFVEFRTATPWVTGVVQPRVQHLVRHDQQRLLVGRQ